MWTTRLLVLGLVRWLQPVHGYEVQRELASWGVGNWANIKQGSIYHALRKLTTDRHLTVAGTEQVDNRPARTSYCMTPRGEVEFQALLRDRLWDPSIKLPQFWVAWSFIIVLSHRETTVILKNRANYLQHRHRELIKSVEQRSTDPRHAQFIPKHVARQLELQATLAHVEASWCIDTAAEAASGQLYQTSEATMDKQTIQTWKEHISNMGPPPLSI